MTALACLGAWPALAPAQTVATRIAADPAAPRAQQPTVLNAGNGVPLVNIHTPSAAGVSRNRYSQFDVGAQGVILNNSRTDSRTQLGGWVQGNPWLASGGARVILNEVQSPFPSQLHGPVEVAGRRAEVVLANPSGISVNGGVFINASGVTLTTGSIVMGHGALEAYQVRGGTVRIDGDGLDTRTADYTAILGRALEANAGLWARRLQVVTGAYSIGHGDLATDAAPLTAPLAPAARLAPSFALDVSELGGMYADRITLVGTEAGLGVRNAGQVLASAGSLLLSHEGWLSNSGTLQAEGGDVSVQVRGDLMQSGTISGTGHVLVAAQGRQTHAGTLAAQGNLRLVLHGDQVLGGALRAGGDLRLDTDGRLTNPVSVAAGRDLLVRARDLDNQADGELLAGQASRVQVTGTFTNRGLVDGADTRIDAQAVDNVGTGRIFGDRVAIQAAHVGNREETRDGVTRAATLGGRERLDIGAAHLVNRHGALIVSGGDMAVGGGLDAAGQATGSAVSIDNLGATVDAARHLRMAADAIRNTNPGLRTAVRQVAQGPVTEYQHSAGDVIRGGDASLRFSPDEVTISACESQCMTTRTGTSDGYLRYDFTRTVTDTVVTASQPGRIVSGGDMALVTRQVTNHDSQVVAGGRLDAQGARVDNLETAGARVTNEEGSVTALWRRRQRGQDSYDTRTDPYAPAPRTETQPLHLVRFDAQAADAAGAVAPVPSRNAALPEGLPAGSLYTHHPESGARYLVEADPRFTRYRTWLGSDYLLQALQLDPATTLQRLGDAFYEQRLVREQVLSLTGQRHLGDFSSDEAAYRALMDAGATVARAWNLRPGIALTSEQVARLTSDIVWLVSREVTLPDGSRRSVLVPQVYLRVRPGDVDGSGALLAGRELTFNLSGDLASSGTVAGRQLLRIHADNIRNLGGFLGADDLALQAAQDIDSTGGRIQGQSAATVVAGRDITVATTTASSGRQAGSNRFAQTGIDRVAGLYVTGPEGTLVAEAGRDLHLIAAQVRNAGSGPTVLSAARDVNLGALTTGQTQALHQDSRNFLQQSESRDIGSDIQAGGSLAIVAGRDATLQAARVAAGGALAVVADGTVHLAAGQDRRALEASSHRSSGDAWSRTTVTTHDRSRDVKAVIGSLSGQSVQVLGRNVISEGAQFQSQGLLQVEGADRTLLYEVQSVRQRDSQREERSATLGFTTRRRDAQDGSLETQSLGTRLQSDRAIRIGVGAAADLRGATVDAPQIDFVRSQGADTSQPGQLLLGTFTDVAQDSHTQRTVTAGVWQSQSGQGGTTQTARQTQLQGQTNFAPGLRVTAQVGLQPGQTLTQQVQVLSQQPGLSYLRDLPSTPGANLQAVELAREQWRYSQQGLTPAGAALLSMAVAVATGGMGAEFLGITGAASGTAVNAGFSALAAQAGVALVNNGGDIGRALETLGSSAAIRNTVAAMLTAGVGGAAAGQGGSAVAAQAVAGCVGGAVTGAGCSEGARTAALLSGAAESYQALVGYPARPGPGDNRHGTNHLGETTGNGTYVPVGYASQPPSGAASPGGSPEAGASASSPVYVPEPGRGPGFGQQRVPDQGMNVIGLNEPGMLLSQGGSVSRFLNRIPFINATGGLHDYIFNRDPGLSFGVWNVPMMVPAAVLSIPAALGHPTTAWITQIEPPRPRGSAPGPAPAGVPSLVRVDRTPIPSSFRNPGDSQ